jgi:hypothetical protein
MKKILFFVMIVITTPVLMSCDKVGLLAQQRSLSDPPNPVRVEGIVTSLTTGKIIITDLVTGIVTSIDVNSIITPRYVKYTDGTIRKEHGGAAGDVISTYTLCRPC